MAPLPHQSRSRLRRPVQAPPEVLEDSDRDDDASISEEEPPRKRMRILRPNTNPRPKWIPGGPGGGGRHIDSEDFDIIAESGRNIDEYLAPPRRRATMHKKMVATPQYSAQPRTQRAPRPRYSTAAAASAAVAHGDGYKPREERSWEEFHPDLELSMDFAIIESESVDGVGRKLASTNGLDSHDFDVEMEDAGTPSSRTLGKKRAGRPVRNRDSMLSSLIIPEVPKIIPVPGPNPRERLTLPKPSFRGLDPFVSYDAKDIASMNFVDKTMAHVGYQESELFLRPERTLIRQMQGSAEEDLDLIPDLLAEGDNSAIGSSGVGRVEYDMDEQDVKWLDAFNRTRTKDSVGIIRPAVFEITMTKIEKEWHALEKRIPKPNPKAPQTQRPRSSSAAAVNGEPGSGDEPDSKCAICDDGDCENANAIVFCDGCDLAVHQECYGVPYIPEGQWLCRKCQLVGNARPSCIFCPTEGGAFKQTNNSKWAHLFCATWIPEVGIGNPSLMEPITDVEKVPPSRWKLGCYICNQNMGASVQCSDGRCYEPFHLTCARQAGLYLKMKTGGGQNSLMDPSQLRAYCHKHTPMDWREEHDTDQAFDRARAYFKEHFRGQVWADSRTSALAITESHEGSNTDKGPIRVTVTNKKGQKPKTIWRLPSGAPVIPEALLKSIEESLVRFGVQKKKDYAVEVCKYWTLKREARRGAALLKRLQLQMDTFSSFEVTRRDYKAQGAAGRARLDRRIAFAERLALDLGRIRTSCDLIRQREAEKLKEAVILRQVVDTIYFPISMLLGPILDRVIRHDLRGVYRSQFLDMRSKLARRYYTTVSAFSAELGRVLSSRLDVSAVNVADLQSQIGERTTDVSIQERDARTLARKLLKAAQAGLVEAFHKEAELTGRPFAQEIKDLEAALSRRDSLADSIDVVMAEAEQRDNEDAAATTEPQESPEPIELAEVSSPSKILRSKETNTREPRTGPPDLPQDSSSSHVHTRVNGELLSNSAVLAVNTPPASTNGLKPDFEHPHSIQTYPAQEDFHEPPTPPISLQGQASSEESQHGIPWYVEQFDIDGTTVHEERWTGPEVLRDMSEELSEMDEDELEGLGGAHIASEGDVSATIESISPSKKSDKKSGKAKRGHGWGERSFRIRRR